MNLAGRNLLLAIGRALSHHASEVQHGCLAPQALARLAATLWEQWRAANTIDQLSDELQALARLPRKALPLTAADELNRLPSPLTPTEMAGYLGRVQTLVRSTSWGQDGSGLEGPEDLEPLLPILIADLQPGSRPWPDEDLTLVERLDRGNSGEVWKANDSATFSERAKHVLAVKFALGLLALERMRHEAEAVNRLFAPGQPVGIVRLVRNLLDRSPPALVFEYIEGGNLTDLIRDMHAQGQPSPATVARTVYYLARIVSGLHRLSPPLVHGDLKPANILVQRLPEQRLRLFVTDFGASDGGGYTPPYASAGQVLGLPLTPRDDVHALGVIWLQLQTGTANLDSEERIRANLGERGVPGPLVALLLRCLDGIEDSGELAQALARELAELLKQG